MAHPSSLSANLRPVERFVLTCIRQNLDPLRGYWSQMEVFEATDDLITQGMVEMQEMKEEYAPIHALLTEKGITALWEI
jgi:hypothetical protein